jgi:STE24 endopeptidase
VRIILLVLLFVVWESSADAAHWTLLPPAPGIPLFFTGYALLILLARLGANRVARGLVRGDLGRAVDRFNIIMSLARGFIPLWLGAAIYLLGWRSVVDRLLGPVAQWPLILPGAVLGLTPAFIAWMGLWWSQYPLDRALREQNLLYQLEADLPVFAPPVFRGYFLNKLRVQLLFTIVPLLLILALRDLATVGVAGISHTTAGQRWGVQLPISDSVDSVLSFGSVLIVLLFSPELLRHVLHTQRLPESPLRQSLSELCTEAGIRCREILLWRTQNNLGNAAVMGLLPRIRYVMLSDLLLESMTDLQIQAVFAHELGHVKHRHLAWFVLFFLTVGTGSFAIAALLGNRLPLQDNWRTAFDITSQIACGILLIVGFGFLSRWFERQADVFAARTLDKPRAATPSTTPLTEGFGAAVFASALERVAVVNNIPIDARNWTHGSIATRMKFIHRLGRDPQLAARFDRTGRRVLIGLSMVMALCAAAAIYAARLELLR